MRRFFRRLSEDRHRDLFCVKTMNNEVIARFFDELAEVWDKNETETEQEKHLLLTRAGITDGMRVFDVACGTGAITRVIHEITKSPVVALDLSEKMIGIARRKFSNEPWATFINADFIKFDTDERFDFIVIYNAYPHFSNVEKLSKKAYSLLTDDGLLAIIHSASHEKINRHHGGTPTEVSRNLLTPTEEAEKFKKLFTTTYTEETESSFILTLKKRTN